MPFSRALPPLANLGSLALIFLVSAISIALALISAFLMAFIQYQDRLLKAQPRVTTAQLMSDVQAEDALKSVFLKIDGQAIARITAGTTYAMALSERDQRAARLCATLMTEDAGESLEKRRRVCNTFLINIPFDRSSPDAEVRPTIDAEDLALIKDRFVQQIPIRSENDKTVVGWLRLFDNDFRKIAQLNLELVERSSNVLVAEQALQESCRTALYTSRAIRYREVDLGNCNAVLMREAQIVLQATAPIAQQGEASRPRETAPRSPQGAAPTLPSAGAAQAASLAGTGAPGAPPFQGLSSASSAFEQGGRAEGSQAEKQLEFELVDHYRFYKDIRWLPAEHLLLSPGEFLILMLVGVSGMMGAFLKMVYAAFATGKDPQPREICLEPVLGLICALTIYILLRAGFLVLTDPTHASGAANLSPFVVAFVSMGGGLASERAMVLFRSSLHSLMGIDEVAQRPRYAVGLKSQLDALPMSAEDLAKALDVAPDLVERWITQDDTVPANLQREVGLVLRCSPRRLFTDLPPA